MARLEIEMLLSMDFDVNKILEVHDFVDDIRNEIENTLANEDCEIFIREYYLEENNDNND